MLVPKNSFITQDQFTMQYLLTNDLRGSLYSETVSYINTEINNGIYSDLGFFKSSFNILKKLLVGRAVMQSADFTV